MYIYKNITNLSACMNAYNFTSLVVVFFMWLHIYKYYIYIYKIFINKYLYIFLSLAFFLLEQVLFTWLIPPLLVLVGLGTDELARVAQALTSVG